MLAAHIAQRSGNTEADMDDFTTFENVDAARRRYARDCVAALASGRMASDQVNKVSNPFSPIFMAREAEEGIAGPQYGRVDNEELRRWPQDEMGLICNFIKLFKCTRNWECWERHNDGDAVAVLWHQLCFNGGLHELLCVESV